MSIGGPTLGGTWSGTITLTYVVGNTTVGNVSFAATANGSLIHIVATIDDATEEPPSESNL